MDWKNKIQRTHNEDLDKNRSRVRQWVTYAATLYVFGMGALLLYCADKPYFKEAKDLYLTVLPIATGVITYWFASRKQIESSPTQIGKEHEGEKGNHDSQPGSQSIHDTQTPSK